MHILATLGKSTTHTFEGGSVSFGLVSSGNLWRRLRVSTDCHRYQTWRSNILCVLTVSVGEELCSGLRWCTLIWGREHSAGSPLHYGMTKQILKDTLCALENQCFKTFTNEKWRNICPNVLRLQLEKNKNKTCALLLPSTASHCTCCINWKCWN